MSGTSYLGRNSMRLLNLERFTSSIFQSARPIPKRQRLWRTGRGLWTGTQGITALRLKSARPCHVSGVG